MTRRERKGTEEERRDGEGVEGGGCCLLFSAPGSANGVSYIGDVASHYLSLSAAPADAAAGSGVEDDGYVDAEPGT